MFKVCVHIMGTPELEVEEAVSFVAQLGFDGIEIVCSNDYKCAILVKPSPAQLNNLRSCTKDLGLAIANIVPYAKELNSLIEKRRRTGVDEIKSVIDIADRLNCPSIRILAGEDATDEWPTSTDQLVESLAEIGEYLSKTEITANIENHGTTEAVSAEKTSEIVRRVDSKHIGILYDPTNLIVLGDQDYAKCYKIQAPFINHVHLKDLKMIEGTEISLLIGGRPIASPPYHPQQFGKGQTPLADILNSIVNDGTWNASASRGKAGVCPSPARGGNEGRT